MDIDKLKVYSGKPIEIDSEYGTKVYQPTVDEIVNLGEIQFNELILPIIITTNAVFNGLENEDELIEKYKIFDVFFIQSEQGKSILDDSLFNGKKAMDVLVDSISFFTHVDKKNIQVFSHLRNTISINGFIVDRDNFHLLRNAIQSTLSRGDIEIEKPPKDMGKRQRDIWEKLQAGRRRKAEKDALYIQDIMNFVQFGGDSYIPLREILIMTYYQLLNAYKSILGKEAFVVGTMYKISPNFEVKEEVKHWTGSLKIGK